MTNVILDTLPENVTIQGITYQFNTDFRVFMRFEMLMADPMVHDDFKSKLALEMFYGEQFIVDEEEALQAILFMYVGEEISSDTQSKDLDPIYSFEEDGDLIYTSFMEAYGVDLSIEKMHWWKFKPLFYYLPESTIMRKVMGYRAKEITSDMSKEEIRFYQDMKALYALKQNKTASEKERDFADSLWG